MLMPFVLAFAAVILDQITKIWSVRTFPPGTPEMEIGLGFYFTHTKNTGAAFGILQSKPNPFAFEQCLSEASNGFSTLLCRQHMVNGTFWLGVLSAVVSLFLIWYLLKHHRVLPRVQVVALGFILGGAIGNMIDRFRLGYVNDFIHFHLPNFDFPVFNVADSCVVIGAGLLILSSFFEPKTEKTPATQHTVES